MSACTPCGVELGHGSCAACFDVACKALGPVVAAKKAREAGLVRPLEGSHRAPEPRSCPDCGEAMPAEWRGSSCSACVGRRREEELNALAPCAGCGAPTPKRTGTCSECRERQAKLWALEEQGRRVGAVRASIPRRYAWVSFEAPELLERLRDHAAIAAAGARATLDLDRLILTGPAGAGKTVLACCTLVRLAELGRVGLFVEARTLAIARAQTALGREAPEVAAALGAEVLVLDDLSADRPSMHSALADVIHARHAECRPTIVTSGFTDRELAAAYGEGIARRLFEHGAEVPVSARPTKTKPRLVTR